MRDDRKPDPRRAAASRPPRPAEIARRAVFATRPRVSQAAARLKGEGIIDYRRGTMRILDRQRLEAIACECYGQTKRYSTNLQ